MKGAYRTLRGRATHREEEGDSHDGAHEDEEAEVGARPPARARELRWGISLARKRCRRERAGGEGRGERERMGGQHEGGREMGFQIQSLSSLYLECIKT
jgi:hypothetical protein